MSRFLALLLVLLACVWALPAAAQDDTAAKAFAEGRRLFNEGEPGLALPLFREALERTDSPNARLFIARCLRDTGKLVEAYIEMRRTLEDARELAADEKRYEATRDAAAAELAKLDKRVGRVVVAVPDEVDAPTITVAGRALAAAERGQPAPVMPGEIDVSVTAEGWEAAAKKVVVAAGQLETVVMTMTRKSGGPAVTAEPPAPAPDAPEEVDRGFGVVRALGIGVAVLGLGGVVMAAVTGSMVQSNVDQIEAECGGTRCTDPSYGELIDDTKTLQLLTNIGAFAGGGLLVAGTLMIIFGGPDDDSEAAARMSLVPLPGGFAAGYSLRF